MKHHSHIRPGYDCRVHCPHEPKGEHGIHCDEWVYVVSDGDVALDIVVWSAHFPPTVPSRITDDFRVRATGMNTHCGFHLEEDAIRRGLPLTNECEYLDGGRCIDDVSGAEAFFEAHGDFGGFEQPERFWRAMEAELAKRAPALRAARADRLWKRCACCDGRGVLAIEAATT